MPSPSSLETCVRIGKRAIWFTRREVLISGVGGAVGALAPATPCHAGLASESPTKSINLIVPLPPSSTPDLVARWLAEGLRESLAYTAVVENRPGGGSLIGANMVVNSPADGHTLLVATSALAINATLHQSLPYDSTSALAPLAVIARGPFVLVVAPSLPVYSLTALVELAKKMPGELTYGSTGTGTPGHLYGELLQSLSGIRMTHVPYSGAGALNDVMTGQISLMFADFAPVVGLIRSGKVRALGVTSKARPRALPDLPLMCEAIAPEFEVAPWVMIAAPARTPRLILENLHKDLLLIIDDAKFEERIIEIGMTPMGTMSENASLDTLQTFLISEIARWADLVRRARIAGTQ